MVYRAPGESKMTNIAQGEAPAIFVTRLSPSVVYIPYKQSSSALSVLWYFALIKS